MQHPEAVLVHDERQQRAVARERELFDLPGDAAREVLIALGREVEIGEPLDLRLAIGGEIDPLTIPTEPRAPVGDPLARALWGGPRLLAARRVQETGGG